MKNKFKPISITGHGSISPLGLSRDEVWNSYLKNEHHISKREINGKLYWTAGLKESQKVEIETLRESSGQYKNLDLTTLFSIYGARQAVKMAGWAESDMFGVNIGSSRGATGLFEKYYHDFLQNGRSTPHSSPDTTLGNISSWVAQDLKTEGPEFSHSITCSTGMHAILNGCAWIQADMSEKFLVGGSEAPLTEFTISQMRALRIYSNDLNERFPSQSGNLKKKLNSIVLGEGSSVMALEKGVKDNAMAYIVGIGYASEKIKHSTSLTKNGECLQKSMENALVGFSKKDVDIIISHTPGTRNGDMAEIRAIEQVFKNQIPLVTNNKWKIGHTFGASGNFSAEMAILMLENQKFINTPFQKGPSNVRNLNLILINSVGFGGNAVSILLSSNPVD